MIENVFWSRIAPHIEPGLIICGALHIGVDADARIETSTIDPIAHHLRDFKDMPLHRISIRYRTRANIPMRVVTTVAAR